MARVVGIDLGTTYSVVAHVDSDGRPQVIPNRYGKPITPSVVYFGSNETLVGEDARDRQAAGATEVAAVFKRHIGERHFIQEFGGKEYTPIDLSALVLADLKRSAEAYFKEPVNEAVITVPAYFTHIQREATMAAGKLAGLRVLSIISEPTAASLAYGLRPSDQEQTVLVYDLGGGTFDISLVRIGTTELTVLATDGDHHLGGRDWDDRVASYLLQRFHDEFGFDLVSDDFNELVVQAEALKRTLSSRESTQVRVQAQGCVGTYELTRAQFEEMTRDLMERTQHLTERVLADSGMQWPQLTGVVPVGGSTKMPMVRAYIERMSGRPPMGGVNPDEAVALGAAIWVGMETHQTVLRYRLATVRDVVAHSLGMIAESEDRSRYLNSVIIAKNLTIPAIETRPYQFTVRQGSDSRLEVFLTQGETENPQESAFLGLYVFSGFPALAHRKAVIDICYAYDKNAVVSVTAKERSTGKDLTLTIEPLPPDVPARFLGKPSDVRVRQHLIVYLAFDLSGSMSGDPLAQAQRAAKAFVSNCDLSTTSIGLIAFSDTVTVTQTATQNAAQITRAIDRMTCGQTGYGNDGQPFDAIYDGMQPTLGDRLSNLFGGGRGNLARSGATPARAAESHLAVGDSGHALPGGGAGAAHEGGSRYGIVLTDGVWSNQPHAINQAKRCHQAGIEIIAIGFGGADERFLRDVASSTEQGFFTDLGSLTDAFMTIAQELTESSGERRVGAGLRKR